MVTLRTPLKNALPAHAAKQLNSHRGLETVEDLLWFLPRRYLDRQTDLGSLREGDPIAFVGQVVTASTRRMLHRRGRMLNATVRTTGGQEIDLTFFSAYGHELALKSGVRGIFAGQVGRYGARWQLAHPAYEVFGEEDSGDRTSLDGVELFPIYLDVPKLPSFTISRLAAQTLLMMEEPPALVPEEVRCRRELPTFVQAMEMVHRPKKHADHHRGMKALKYEEALVLQVVLAKRRNEQAQAMAVPRDQHGAGLLTEFDRRMPFTLTDGQTRVCDEILADLARKRPMNRLLQGEVGSGKTVVALRAMLAVVDAGGQAVLLAPTEVLAAQHFRSIRGLLGDLAEGGLLGGSTRGTTVTLLTGHQNTTERRRALLEAASGQAGIVVGTHALLQDGVDFADLGLVVVDEQHRFGVEQRDSLRKKARAGTPHVLVMTATPIPRTVAMTVFGDMDTSVLDQVPAGRSPIVSHVVDNPRWYDRTWERLAEEVRGGHQAYVVCPRIGESDEDTDLFALSAEEAMQGEHEVDNFYGDEEYDEWGDPLPDPDLSSGESGRRGTRPPRGVLSTLEELREHPALQGLRIGLLHGRLPAEEKESVMNAFSGGEIDVLVATTIVEVGVDVPNATTMVVLDADRFGVSQLHQLRGRVGRGTAAGLCLLVTGSRSSAARERLGAVASTTDGFELSRLDLRQRREGDVLGAKQAGGASSLKVLRVRTDEQIIVQAREDALAIVGEDASLTRYPVLAAAVDHMMDAERAAFLERG
ncbi:ATP-dependent DNA helicase RecG [Austwickia chelonae]|uniref:ATP-dependent DNA helicase RecG n=1 Tax=Austwickia chelonae NBRC 105200 TaxID=1184607 RepID=K6UKP8_9MICO|nr:ATP-dependent DNA helicase RecG [Austwickia chelonae]GAB76591.1 ATP-dependent DNA helicase RecG [Austwickia chelonae NBRC 105200]SEW27543.1 ATP-dependent DNA helicase RecG [Austwickia chelonae]